MGTALTYGLFTIGVMSMCMFAMVAVDDENVSAPTWAGAIGGAIAGMFVSPMAAVLFALAWGAGARAWAVLYRTWGDGDPLRLGVLALALPFCPLLAPALVIEVADRRESKAAALRREGERIWREEFRRSGEGDAATFVASDPRAVAPRSVLEAEAGREDAGAYTGAAGELPTARAGQGQAMRRLREHQEREARRRR
jgi:hypothetical protein